MKKTGTNNKKKNRVVPITFFVLFLATCGFNGDVAGFCLFLAFISFMFSAMMDPIVKPIAPKDVGSFEEWVAREPSRLFEDFEQNGAGASLASCGIASELQSSPLAGVGEAYSDII